MLLKRDLGWTRGFPAALAGPELRWLVPDSSAAEGLRSEPIERGALRRAEWAANDLRRDFPRVFPRLVGDPAAWRARLDTVLGFVKGAVHGGHTLPADLLNEPSLYGRAVRAKAGGIARAWPALHPLVAALSWVHAVDQEEAATDLAWVESHTEPLSVMVSHADAVEGLVAGVLLCKPAAHLGAGRLASLVTLLGDPRLYRISDGGAGGYTSALRTALEPPGSVPSTVPPRPDPDFAPLLLRWVRVLYRLDHRAAQRALRLLEATRPAELVSAWARWWDGVERVSGPVAESVRLGVPPERGLLNRTYAKLKELEDQAPPCLPCETYLECLVREARPEARAHYRASVAALDALPHDLPPVAGASFLMHWSLGPRDESLPASLPIPSLLAGFHAYLQAPQRPSAVWLRPWEELAYPKPVAGAIAQRYHYFLPDVLDELKSKRDIAAFFKALRLVSARVEAGIDWDGALELAAIVRCAGDAALAARLLTAAHESGVIDNRDYCASFWKAAIPFAGDDDASLPAVLRALARQVGEDEDEVAKVLQGVVETFAAAGCIDVLRRVLAADSGSRLGAAGRRWRLLRALGGGDCCAPERPQAVAQVPSRAREFPAALHPSIRQLAAVHPGAKAATVAILRRSVPREADIRRELAVLERAVDLAIFEKWERETARRLVLPVPAFLGVSAPPPWIHEERQLSLLFAVLQQLDGPMRDLALRLLRARCGPPPWDLRDAPPNRRFLTALEQRGVKVGPWVEGIGRRDYGAGDTRLTLELEDDPLEVFRMGSHFKTCLSVGSFNFFSVIANAADINKRVLYARDDHGQVQGRCLLALTDAGGILAFHVYRHDRKADPDGMVRQFVAEPAGRMGVVAAPSGRHRSWSRPIGTMTARLIRRASSPSWPRDPTSGSACRRRLLQSASQHSGAPSPRST